MKTEFTSYTLLGSGRVARHFRFYLKSLGLPVSVWSRNADPEFNSYDDSDADRRLMKALAGASHVLFAVSDRALTELAGKIGGGRTLVHFSGAAVLEGVHAAHPLMTFAEDLQPREWYERVPFVLDQGDKLDEVLPGLHNPYLGLPREKRALYHALVSLAGNSSFLLWRNIGDSFEKQLELPRELLASFLHQVVDNATHSREGAFTGPVARGDWSTVSAHIRALEETPLLRNYRDFLNSASRSGHPVPKEML